ncbi:hypothetical protein Salat_1096100 [Sesamum alatum]|uniref:DUF4283 domain-containing protein n=1 Tax=Sesamum alatum TaxID=300844 RepID=A0AAE2CSY3_9LAMI|nr:hypothetical protein Salat_1096100 [Sesamum alatum]
MPKPAVVGIAVGIRRIVPVTLSEMKPRDIIEKKKPRLLSNKEGKREKNKLTCGRVSNSCRKNSPWWRISWSQKRKDLERSLLKAFSCRMALRSCRGLTLEGSACSAKALLTRIHTLWKPSGDIELIDMGSNCFCLRMEDKEDRDKLSG